MFKGKAIALLSVSLMILASVAVVSFVSDQDGSDAEESQTGTQADSGLYILFYGITHDGQPERKTLKEAFDNCVADKSMYYLTGTERYYASIDTGLDSEGYIAVFGESLCVSEVPSYDKIGRLKIVTINGKSLGYGERQEIETGNTYEVEGKTYKECYGSYPYSDYYFLSSVPVSENHRYYIKDDGTKVVTSGGVGRWDAPTTFVRYADTLGNLAYLDLSDAHSKFSAKYLEGNYYISADYSDSYYTEESKGTTLNFVYPLEDSRIYDVQNSDVIPPKAFYKNNSIEEIVLPDNLVRTYIHCISQMPNLEWVHTRTNLNTDEASFPNSMVIFGEGTFYGLDDEYDENKVLVKDYKNMKGMKLIIPTDHEIYLGSSAFAKMEFVGDIDLSNAYYSKVTDTRNKDMTSTFSNASFRSVKLSDVDSIIPNSFFSGNKTIESITIGSHVVSIGSSAFKGCTNLSGDLSLPEGLTTIGDDAFNGCASLGTELNESGTYKSKYGLTIPSSVKYIGKNAFYNCAGFISLVLEQEDKEEELETIGDNAFLGCSGFKNSLTIPESVNIIGNNAFNGCGGFTGSLTVNGTDLVIGNYAFSGCNGLTGLTLNEGVKSMGTGVFSGCSSNLTGILIIPSTMFSIGDSAFEGFTGFDKLVLNYGLQEIGKKAFKGCTGFSGALTIPDSVTVIGNEAFSGCTQFSGSLTLSGGLTTIGNNAFNGCKGFTGDLVIPDSVGTIGVYAFNECEGFDGSLTIPDSVTEMGNRAFRYCKNLTGELDLPDNIQTIPDALFLGCSKLTGALIIPDSVTSIGAYAFKDTNFSGYILIPSSVTSIGYYAFSRAAIEVSEQNDIDGIVLLGGEVQLVAGSNGSRSFFSNISAGVDARFYVKNNTVYGNIKGDCPADFTISVFGDDAIFERMEGNVPLFTKNPTYICHWVERSGVTNPKVADAGYHELMHKDGKSASSSSEGNIEHYACDGCGSKYEDSAGSIKLDVVATVLVELLSDPVDSASFTYSENGVVTAYSAGFDVLKGSDVTITVAPGAGYRFKSWENGDTNLSVIIVDVSGYTKKTATLELGTQYTLRYDPNGGSGSSIIDSVSIGVITLDSTYSGKMTGFVFVGWNTQSDGLGAHYATGADYNWSDSTTHEITLYAQWVPITYYAIITVGGA